MYMTRKFEKPGFRFRELKNDNKGTVIFYENIVYEHVHDYDTVISVCNNAHLHFFNTNDKIFTSQELRSAPRLNCAFI